MPTPLSASAFAQSDKMSGLKGNSEAACQRKGKERKKERKKEKMWTLLVMLLDAYPDPDPESITPQ